MSNKNKSYLIYGFLMFVSLFLQSRYWATDSSGSGILKSLVSSLIGAIIATLLYRWLMNKFFSSKMSAGKYTIETEPGEDIKFVGSSKYTHGLEVISGKLYLTDKRLVFKSDKWNFHNHELSINFRDIQKAETYKPMHITTSGLGIELLDGNVEKFLVAESDEWITRINDRMRNNIV